VGWTGTLQERRPPGTRRIRTVCVCTHTDPGVCDKLGVRDTPWEEGAEDLQVPGCAAVLSDPQLTLWLGEMAKASPI
jgi:hypothetical protein